MAKSRNFAKDWFTAKGWKPFAFQKDVWKAVKEGQSGLLHASTGAGKTYALWFAAQRYQHMQNVKTPSAAEVNPGARATEAWKS